MSLIVIWLKNHNNTTIKNYGSASFVLLTASALAHVRMSLWSAYLWCINFLIYIAFKVNRPKAAPNPM